MTHICVGKLTIIGSDNGLSPEQRQAIIWTNAGILVTGPLGTNFSEILIEIQTFSLKKIRLKMLSAKCCSFRLGLNVLIPCTEWTTSVTASQTIYIKGNPILPRHKRHTITKQHDVIQSFIRIQQYHNGVSYQYCIRDTKQQWLYHTSNMWTTMPKLLVHIYLQVFVQLLYMCARSRNLVLD